MIPSPPATSPLARRRGPLATFDCALLLLVRRWESTFLTSLMRGLTRLGDTESWILAGLILAAAGGGARHSALLLFVGAALATTVSQVLKRLARRPRPAEGIRGFACLVATPDELSFPSGHTSVAFAVAVALAGDPTGTVALVIASGIGASRIYLGAHYPLDVAAGVLVGTGSGWCARLLVDGSLLTGWAAGGGWLGSILG
jgi:undecaprenyl-diphosphatase